MAQEQVEKGFVALRVLPLELEPAWTGAVVSECGDALALQPIRQRKTAFAELLGIVAAAACARNDQGSRSLGVADAEMQCAEASHGEAADMGLLDAEMVKKPVEVFNRVVL